MLKRIIISLFCKVKKKLAPLSPFLTKKSLIFLSDNILGFVKKNGYLCSIMYESYLVT